MLNIVLSLIVNNFAYIMIALIIYMIFRDGGYALFNKNGLTIFIGDISDFNSMISSNKSDISELDDSKNSDISDDLNESISEDLKDEIQKSEDNLKANIVNKNVDTKDTKDKNIIDKKDIGDLINIISDKLDIGSILSHGVPNLSGSNEEKVKLLISQISGMVEKINESKSKNKESEILVRTLDEIRAKESLLVKTLDEARPERKLPVYIEVHPDYALNALRMTADEELLDDTLSLVD